MRASTQKETLHASTRTRNVSGLRAPKAFTNGALPSSATNVQVHEMFLHPAHAALVQMTEKAIPRRAPLSLQPRALGLCSGCTSACHVRASSFEDLLAKTRWPLCSAPYAPSVPPTEPWGRSVPVQIAQRLDALGPQPTSGALGS